MAEKAEKAVTKKNSVQYTVTLWAESLSKAALVKAFAAEREAYELVRDLLREERKESKFWKDRANWLRGKD